MNTLVMPNDVRDIPAAAGPSSRFLLWIDRVGVYLVSLHSEFTIGGPATEGRGADLALLAGLSRRHATLERSGERYVIRAHAPAFVAGRPVHEAADLSGDSEIQLGQTVRLRFRQPSVLSGSACLDFISDHRPARFVDGVVLMDQTCLIGPAPDCHVVCPAWPQTVLLFRSGAGLCCKARDDLFIDGRHCREAGELCPGSVVTAADIRFRIENLP